MKILLFGATGMVGQGVLRELLLDPGVARVRVVGRSPTGRTDAKLDETVRADLFDLAPVADDLSGYDACLFCLGVSSAGMREADYTRVTYDLTLSVARALLARNPGMKFVYVSGESTDATERGKTMWARVKGKTENELLRMPFGAAYMFRPGFIKPMHGETPSSKVYRALYALIVPLASVVRALAPNHVTTTENVGRAMLRVLRDGSPSRVIASREIEKLAQDR